MMKAIALGLLLAGRVYAAGYDSLETAGVELLSFDDAHSPGSGRHFVVAVDKERRQLILTMLDRKGRPICNADGTFTAEGCISMYAIQPACALIARKLSVPCD